MRISLNTTIKKSVEEDLKNLSLLLDEHAADYDLNPFKIKTVFLSTLDDNDDLSFGDTEVRAND